MSQSQIAGGSVSSPGQYPTRGFRLRDFALKSVDGSEVHPSDYRGRRNLVLVFAGRPEQSAALLAQFGQCFSQLQEEEAQVLAVVQAGQEAVELLAKELVLPFPLLVDADGRTHHDFGAADAEARTVPAIYITDRYGEVYASYRSAIGQPLPSMEELVNSVSYINRQCPECEPPEWPL